jgi:hypothetical protein
MAARKRVSDTSSQSWKLVRQAHCVRNGKRTLKQIVAEIVISLLLRRFRFSFSDKKIIWKMNGLNQPIIEDAELDQHGLPMLQMPLRVVPLSDA